MITARHRISFVGFVFVGLLVVLGGAWAGYTSARADTPLVAQADIAPAPAAVQVEPFAPPAEKTAQSPSSAPSATSAAEVTPAEKLRNPADDPIGAFDDARAAYKQGWAFFLLACLVMLTAGLVRAAKKWPSSMLLAWFVTHATLLYVIECVGAVAAAAFDALARGGTWYAVGYVALGAVLTIIAPKPGESA